MVNPEKEEVIDVVVEEDEAEEEEITEKKGGITVKLQVKVIKIMSKGDNEEVEEEAEEIEKIEAVTEIKMAKDIKKEYTKINKQVNFHKIKSKPNWNNYKKNKVIFIFIPGQYSKK